MSLDSRTEPRLHRIRRRVISHTRLAVFFIVLTGLAPVLLTGAVVVDAARWLWRRTPWMAVRMLAFFWVYLAVEIGGITAMFGDWLMAGFGRRREWMVERAYTVQRWWARRLFGSVRRLFRLELVVEGEEHIRPGPILAMFRHASIVDNLLPALLITDRQKMKLRWIIKRELLADAALDVGGNRMPNYFVDREGDTAVETARIRELAANLGPDDGMLLFPEGTRFTAEKRERILTRLRERGSDLAERAGRLRHLLPPRIGGALTLLDAGYDVVLCGHQGLGGFARLSDIWSGGMIGRTINVRFWRFSGASIPTTRQERVDWLFARWQTIDDWIDGLAGA